MNDQPTIDSVLVRLRSRLSLKLVLLVVLNVVVYGPYIYLQHHHFFPARTMSVNALDRAIPFLAQTVWVYLSISLLMPIGPFLMTHRTEILRYASGIVLIGLVADVIFLFWPTISPRPDTTVSNPAYQALISLDDSFHAFPSLHAAFAVYSALCASLVLQHSPRFLVWQAALWLWTLLILLATLTTKQHVLADILGGSALGFLAFTTVFARWKSSFSRKTPVSHPTPNLSQPETP